MMSSPAMCNQDFQALRLAVTGRFRELPVSKETADLTKLALLGPLMGLLPLAENAAVFLGD
jgi:hypothetical protein